jgi:hypothetical protein
MGTGCQNHLKGSDDDAPILDAINWHVFAIGHVLAQHHRMMDIYQNVLPTNMLRLTSQEMWSLRHFEDRRPDSGMFQSIRIIVWQSWPEMGENEKETGRPPSWRELKMK